MTTMTDDDRAVIRRFAAGEKELREKALAIYKRCFNTEEHTLEMKFMFEIDSLVPDHLLRAFYRQQLTQLSDKG